MRLLLFSFFCLLFFQIPCYSQTEYIEVNSSILKETRQIKLQLPRNYSSTQKEYPVIIVLDGDYLFEPFAGNVDYLSYWEIIPESIVVGINQAGHRNDDGHLDPETEFPSETGADFFEFIGFEVLKHIETNYRTTPFAIIAGMDYMGNFSNFYLLKENSLFKGFINLSPDVTPKLPERLQDKMARLNNKVWYFLATAENDIPSLKSKTETLNSSLSTIENQNVNYRFHEFENADHYSFVADAIPEALQTIFSTYGPISENEYKTKLLEAEYPSYALEDKYLTIQELYALDIPIRVVDFLKTAEAIEEKEKWEDYRNLGNMAKKQSPGTVLQHYFEGRYFEKKGNIKRAVKEYQAAYGLESAGYLNSDVLLAKADELQRIFGE